MLCGSAFKNKGVQTLLDAVVDYLPSPLDVRAIEGIDSHHAGMVLTREPKDDETFSSLAFKLMNDQYGKLRFIRLYSGALKTGYTVLNPSAGRTERVGRLVRMHANNREEIDRELTPAIFARAWV